MTNKKPSKTEKRKAVSLEKIFDEMKEGLGASVFEVELSLKPDARLDFESKCVLYFSSEYETKKQFNAAKAFREPCKAYVIRADADRFSIQQAHPGTGPQYMYDCQCWAFVHYSDVADIKICSTIK